ncbi:hypothetical protein [Stappia sp. ICDLI1TA098]
MADYYPVLKKTVAALPENTGAARREIYQRARKAIVAQLKAYDPPLSPSDITSEQLRLEECIRRVEAEAARDTLGGYSSARPATPTPPPTTAAQPAEPQPAPPPAAPPPVAAPQVAAPQPPEPAAQAPQPAAPRAAAAQPTASPRAPEREKPADADAPAVTGNKRVQPGADSTIAAGNEGLRATPRRDDPQPTARDDNRRTDKREPSLAGPAAGTDTPRTRARGRNKDENGLGAGRQPALAGYEGHIRTSRLPGILGGVAVVLLLVGAAAVGYSQREAVMNLFAGGDSTDGSDTASTGTPADTQTPGPQDGGTNADTPRKNAARLLENGETAVAPDARSVSTTRITPSTPEGVTSAAPQASRDVTSQAAVPTGQEQPATATEAPVAPADQQAQAETPAVPETPAASETPAAPATTPAPAPAASANADQATAVAQRAILYEEGAQPGSAGQASSGQTIWNLSEETVDGRKETVLKIRVQVPERNIDANLTLHPNRDSSLPASHLLEIRFNLPPNFAGGGVQDVPGLVMKPTEEARGEALIGASAKVDTGYFWVALSNLPDEEERNLSLLRDRGWIDIPMLYENGKRAILTLEKGTPGTRAVDQAIDAWKAG